MQTFLPYESFDLSAQSLDYRRLGKQRVEAKQILLALGRTSGGWVNHPAVRMWRGYENALCNYGYFICGNWIERGYRDSLQGWFVQQQNGPIVLPPWLGDPELHRSHQSNLVRKDPDFYRVQFPLVPDDLPYVWPVSQRERTA